LNVALRFIIAEITSATDGAKSIYGLVINRLACYLIAD